MKRALLALALTALALTQTGCFGCVPDYSNGERVGIVTKLSERGLIWKSWEGELLMALPTQVAGNIDPEKFTFNVDPQAVAKVQAALASGQRVTLIYRQWFVKPPSIEAHHVIIDVK